MIPDVVGLELCQAEEILRSEGVSYRIAAYRSFKPYPDADAKRVVRAKEREDGSAELTVCEFKTKASSQG